MAEEGKSLFAHAWQSNDPLSGAGDGLGPVFNAKSCVECHNQGGAGGGGPLENNVTAFTITPFKERRKNRFEAVQTSFSLGEARGGVVHAFATDGNFRETLVHLAPTLPSVSRPPLKDVLPRVLTSCVIGPSIGSAPGVDISLRNTPALFGASLIDAIPDRVIIANERAQRVKWGLTDPRTEDFPVGRALRLANRGVGKFSWKAQIGSLHEVDTDADEDWDTRTLTEYLNDPMNFTGYSQVLRETHIDADTEEIQKVVEYTIGHDQISQTTIVYSSGVPGTPETVIFAADGHGSVRMLLNAAAAIATIAGARQLFHYDAYGNAVGFNTAAAATTVLYSGEHIDRLLNFGYNRDRWLDFSTGRFIGLAAR